MRTTKPGAVTDAQFARLLAFRDGLRRFTHWSEQQAKQAGLTGAQYQLLLAVRGHGSPPSVGRVADAVDQRVVRLEVTAEGQARMGELASAHLEELSRLRPSFEQLWKHLP